MNHDLPPDDTGQGIRKPGAWPVPRSFEEPEPDRRHTADQARFNVTLGVLRAALEEQPSPRAARAALRRWIAAATQIADEVARAMKESGK